VSLDPIQTARDDFNKGSERRHNFTLALNNLELPLFPWKVIPFSPGLFNINDIPDPIDFTGRGIFLR
jgi:hypothetical protein